MKTRGKNQKTDSFLGVPKNEKNSNMKISMINVNVEDQ